MSVATPEGQRHAGRWAIRFSRRRLKECIDSAQTRRAEREGPVGKPTIPERKHKELELLADSNHDSNFIDRFMRKQDLTSDELAEIARYRHDRETAETRSRIERETQRQCPAPRFAA